MSSKPYFFLPMVPNFTT